MEQTLKFTDDSFENEVLNAEADQPVLVDFWAEWCGPCKQIGPVVDELAGEFEGQAKVGKVNIEENSETPTKYGIRSIPSLLIFKNGEVVDQIVGAVPKSKLKKQLQAQVAN